MSTGEHGLCEGTAFERCDLNIKYKESLHSKIVLQKNTN